MIRQLTSASPCKYLHNYYKKKLCKIFSKERKEKKLNCISCQIFMFHFFTIFNWADDIFVKIQLEYSTKVILTSLYLLF